MKKYKDFWEMYDEIGVQSFLTGSSLTVPFIAILPPDGKINNWWAFGVMLTWMIVVLSIGLITYCIKTPYKKRIKMDTRNNGITESVNRLNFEMRGAARQNAPIVTEQQLGRQNRNGNIYPLYWDPSSPFTRHERDQRYYYEHLGSTYVNPPYGHNRRDAVPSNPERTRTRTDYYIEADLDRRRFEQEQEVIFARERLSNAINFNMGISAQMMDIVGYASIDKSPKKEVKPVQLEKID